MSAIVCMVFVACSAASATSTQVTSISQSVQDYVTKLPIPCGGVTSTGQIDWNVLVTADGAMTLPALHVEVQQPQIRSRGFLWSQNTYKLAVQSGVTRVAYDEQWTGPVGDYYLIASIPNGGPSNTCEIHKVAA